MKNGIRRPTKSFQQVKREKKRREYYAFKKINVDYIHFDCPLRNELPPMPCLYIREKKACPGCYGNDNLKSKSCAMCRIKNCEIIQAGKVRYCFACEKYPCANLNHLDKRYRTKYSMSMIDNLEYIKHFGMRNFIKQEKERWACSTCGEIICVHKESCIFCGNRWR